MRLIIKANKQESSKWVADYIVAKINAANPTKDKPFVLGLPTGSSPEVVYTHLVEAHKAGRISFRHVITFNMDEYLNLPTSHPQSYHTFMYTNLFQHVDILPENCHLPSENNWRTYDELIASKGGIDLFLCGVGADGHIAFNEPGSSLASKTRIKTLTHDTRVINARFFGGKVNDVPKSAITVGVKTVMDAKEVVLIADGRGKAVAVKAAVEGFVGHQWTVSALQMHERFVMVVDEDAVEELQVKTVRYFKGIEGEEIESVKAKL